jgi:hypothetical protein
VPKVLFSLHCYQVAAQVGCQSQQKVLPLLGKVLPLLGKVLPLLGKVLPLLGKVLPLLGKFCQFKKFLSDFSISHIIYPVLLMQIWSNSAKLLPPIFPATDFSCHLIFFFGHV